MKFTLPPRPLLWLLLGCLMIAVPLSMIAHKEYILSQGETLRFRLAPIDPEDPFRGRFMTLSFEVERKTYDIPPDNGDDGTPLSCYAHLANDEEGFARIDAITLELPGEAPYLHLSLGRQHSGRIHLPFGRYYMNEKQAPLVETQARNLITEATSQGKPSPVFAVVRIHDGEGVITALMGPKGALDGASDK